MAGNFHYDRNKKKFQSSVWRVCQFLVLAGNWQFFLLWREIFITTGKKKSSSRLSGGCVSFWFRREIGSFFVVAGKFYYDRKKKKIQLSVWRVRDHYYDRKKKRYSPLSGGCAIMSVFLVANVIFVLVQLELNLIQIR